MFRKIPGNLRDDACPYGCMNEDPSQCPPKDHMLKFKSKISPCGLLSWLRINSYTHSQNPTPLDFPDVTTGTHDSPNLDYVEKIGIGEIVISSHALDNSHIPPSLPCVIPPLGNSEVSSVWAEHPLWTNSCKSNLFAPDCWSTQGLSFPSTTGRHHQKSGCSSLQSKDGYLSPWYSSAHCPMKLWTLRQ